MSTTIQQKARLDLRGFLLPSDKAYDAKRVAARQEGQQQSGGKSRKDTAVYIG